ncbi:hypothetical protein [uncultured Herbaspirillum sp.]|nr:hypothetical protein [uncultured Herbaspirillum sp.]
MIQRLIRYLAIFLIWCGLSTSHAEGFDWTLLKGTWAESAQGKFGCSPDNLHQRLSPSRDFMTLFFENDRKWKSSNGQELERYSATIISSSPNVLIIKYNADLTGIPEQYREWEMRFIGPGTYRWRSTSWPIGTYNDVIGVLCKRE